MGGFQRLLILVNGQQGTGQPAIQRALDLSGEGDSHLILLLPVYVPTDSLAAVLSKDQLDVLRRHATTQAEAHLDLLANKLRCQGRSVETRLGWAAHAYEAVVAAVAECQPDVVFAAAGSHGLLERLVVTPEERQLLRFCPCPVWLVKNAPAQGPVIAALDAGNPDATHQALNRRVAETARQLARQLGLPWLSLTAFPGVPVLYPANVSLDIPLMEQEHLSLLRRAARELANPLGLAEADILVEQGSASEVLCNEAEARKASVLVLGSVARTGLNAFLLGNTAEQVVDSVGCDVLALKPEGFVSPLASPL